MPKFRKKPITVEAEQFTDPGRPPRGVETLMFENPDGTQHPAFYVTTATGQRVQIYPGEWVVAEMLVADRYYPVRAEDFAATYDPV